MGSEAKLQVMDLGQVSKVEPSRTDEDGHSTTVLDEIREIALQVKGDEKTLKKAFFLC